MIADAKAAKEDFLRVVDESGEGYLYPADRFVEIKLPNTVVERLQTAISA